MQDLGALRARLLLESKQFKDGMNEARTEMNKTGFSAQQVSKDFGVIQKASFAVGAAVVAGIGASAKVAAGFEQSMARVKAVSGASAEEFERLEKAAREAGATTVFSASDASNALSYLAMAGFKVNEQISALPSVLDLAAAAQIDLGQSADIVSNVMTGFGIKAEDTGKAVDILVKTMTTANTDLPQLEEAMKYVAPIAASLGIGIEETAAAIAKMSDAGIQGSQAGTALRQTLISLTDPTNEAQKSMDKLGIKVNDANGEMKPLPELIGHIAEKFEGMTDAQKTATAAQLVGTEAASGFVTLLGIGEEGLKDYTKELKNSGGTAKTVAETQNATLIGSFKEFQSAVEEAGIKLGKEFLPMFTDLVKLGTDVVRSLTDIDTSTVKSGLAFAGTAAAIALTITTLGKLAIAVKGLMVSMGPAGWLITGISLLGGAIMATKVQEEEAIEVNLDHAKSLQEQSSLLDDQITRYETLKEKNKLSNDEMATFVDLQSRMKLETDPSKIEAMQKQYGELLTNSGLTNDEMAEFLGLNDDIIEKIPTSNAKLTDQGNILLDNTDAAKLYNEQLQREIELELRKQANNASKDLENRIQERTDALAKQNELAQNYLTIQQDIEVQKMRISTEEARLQSVRISGTDVEIAKAEERLKKEESSLGVLEKQKREINGQVIEQEKIINDVELQILKGQEAYQELIKYRLEQIEVTAEKGKELEAIDAAIVKTKELITAKTEEFNADGNITQEEQNQLDKLDDKLEKMGLTRGEVEQLITEQNRLTGSMDESVGVAEDLTYELDKDVEKLVNVDDKGTAKDISDEAAKTKDKSVKVDDNGGAKAISDEAARPVTKEVTIWEKIKRTVTSWFSGDTTEKENRHTGGPLPKKHIGGSLIDLTLPNPQSIQGFSMPLHNEVDVRLLRNEMVLTESQQANLFRMIDAGVNSGRGSGDNTEFMKIIEQLIYQVENLANRPIDVSFQIEGREVARGTYRYINELSENDTRNKLRAKGVFT